MKLRLDKFLADCGKGTRSQVKDYIKKGRVTVNGTAAKSGDAKIDTETDMVCFDKTVLSFQRYVYYMLNKPPGVVSATRDAREKTVIELITEDKPRDLFPVGRLDKDTEGLLLITNDGGLANELLSPKKHVAKMYYVRAVRDVPNGTEVTSPSKADVLVTDEIIKAFLEGVDIGDETPAKPAKLCVLTQNGDEAELYITITEGRYHQVKRMFGAVGLRVVYLKRVSMGSLVLDDKLGLGEYRLLTDAELKDLKENRRKI